MEQRRDVLPISVDQPDGAPSAPVLQVNGTAVEIGVDLELRQPVDDCQRWIAKGACESIAQVGGFRLGTKVDEELADRGAGKARHQEAEQERERRESER